MKTDKTKPKKSEILNELINKQLKKIPNEKKMSYSDLERLVKYIDKSIFDKNSCCLWLGYVTNSNIKKKVKYVNFYFRKKKTALHRMLYINFVKYFDSDGYITYSCENKGKCCNVNHMIYHEYSNKSTKKNNIKDSNDSDTTADNDNNDDNDDNKNTMYNKKHNIKEYYSDSSLSDTDNDNDTYTLDIN